MPIAAFKKVVGSQPPDLRILYIHGRKLERTERHRGAHARNADPLEFIDKTGFVKVADDPVRLPLQERREQAPVGWRILKQPGPILLFLISQHPGKDLAVMPKILPQQESDPEKGVLAHNDV